MAAVLVWSLEMFLALDYTLFKNKADVSVQDLGVVVRLHVSCPCLHSIKITCTNCLIFMLSTCAMRLKTHGLRV